MIRLDELPLDRHILSAASHLRPHEGRWARRCARDEAGGRSRSPAPGIPRKNARTARLETLRHGPRPRRDRHLVRAVPERACVDRFVTSDCFSVTRPALEERARSATRSTICGSQSAADDRVRAHHKCRARPSARPRIRGGGMRGGKTDRRRPRASQRSEELKRSRVTACTDHRMLAVGAGRIDGCAHRVGRDVSTSRDTTNVAEGPLGRRRGQLENSKSWSLDGRVENLAAYSSKSRWGWHRSRRKRRGGLVSPHAAKDWNSTPCSCPREKACCRTTFVDNGPRGPRRRARIARGD